MSVSNSPSDSVFIHVIFSSSWTNIENAENKNWLCDVVHYGVRVVYVANVEWDKTLEQLVTDGHIRKSDMLTDNDLHNGIAPKEIYASLKVSLADFALSGPLSVSWPTIIPWVWDANRLLYEYQYRSQQWKIHYMLRGSK